MNLNLESLYTVSQAELEEDFERVLEKARSGCGPIRILCSNESDILLFDWNDYMERFHNLYTEADLAAIEKACQTTCDEK